jgi:hypothetical protein
LAFKYAIAGAALVLSIQISACADDRTTDVQPRLPMFRCSPGALCVGDGETYPTLASALEVARQNDVIEIVAATYRETAKITVPNLTLRGVNGRPHFDCAGMELSDHKACLLLAADDIFLDNLEISGAVVPDEFGANGACIRNEPNVSFSLKRILCHGSQEGVLTAGGAVLVEDSEFFDNGWTGLTHNFYLSGNCMVTVRRSIFREARAGHEFKSRCIRTDISDSTFRNAGGSRDLDIPDGGETTVYRSTLEMTGSATDHDIIGFAAESCAHPADMILKDVRIVNWQPSGKITNYDKCAGHSVILDGVTFEGIRPKLVGRVVLREGSN